MNPSFEIIAFMRRRPLAHAAFVILSTGLTLACLGTAPESGANPRVLAGTADLRAGHPAVNDDGTVNVVVEIPAGTDAKWEVGEDGALRWEFKDGAPRVVRYLPYPGNYGMVPRTLLSEEQGGDGDPLDVLVLGPARERGSVVRASLVGVLTLLDDGAQDDKLLAVEAGTSLGHVRDLDQLEREFPGVTRIVETWFANYKGAGEIEVTGLGDGGRARAILGAASEAWARAR